MGELVYRAKTYDGDPGELWAANRLGDSMAAGARLAFGRRLFAIASVDLVIPVPAFPPKDPFNLPDVLAEAIAKEIRKPYRDDLLIKVAQTEPAKTTPPEKLEEQLRKAHRVNGVLGGETILLVDDLVRSGTTLATIASLLLEAGSRTVGAFVATRAQRGMKYT